MDVVANNIANADNKTFKRSDVGFATLQPTRHLGVELGHGVEVHSIKNAFTGVIANSISANRSSKSFTDSTLNFYNQIESILSPGEGSLHNRVANFFDQLSALTANPSSKSLRSHTIETAQSMTAEFHHVMEQMVQLKRSAFDQVRSEIESLNDRFAELHKVTSSIQAKRGTGNSISALTSDRDRLLNEISDKIDLNLKTLPNGQILAFAGNGQLAISETKVELSLDGRKSGDFEITSNVLNTNLKFGSGSLASYQWINNSVIPDYEAQLNNLSQEIMQAIDRVHSQGIGINGGFQSVTGSRSVEDPTEPLSKSSIAFPVVGGDMFVSTVDETGGKKLHRLTIDPRVDTLEDFAAKLFSVDGLNATIDPKTKTLSITTKPGMKFDFSGGIESEPDLNQFSGTSKPSLSGTYSGTQNNEFQFEAVSSGEVGVSENLTVQIRDKAGAVMKTVDIGKGYVAGSEIEITDGIKVTFDSGSLLAGDRFSAATVRKSDETGALVALGLNTFFQGTGATTFRVNDHLSDDPDMLATSKNGKSGDSANTINMLMVRDESRSNLDDLSIEQNILQLARRSGTQAQDLKMDSLNLETLRNQLELERTAVAGVDQSEELVKLMQLQKAYQMNAEVITASDENLDVLIALLG